jgi:hypothetical protein
MDCAGYCEVPGAVLFNKYIPPIDLLFLSFQPKSSIFSLRSSRSILT